MRLNSLLILSGSPLKAVLQTLGVFLLLLLLAGYLLVGSVEKTLKHQLYTQEVEESRLLQEIYHRQGLLGLKQALHQVASSERIADAFDDKGRSLTGNIRRVPTAEGGQVMSSLVSSTHTKGTYWGYSVRLDGMTLVVGRSDRIIAVAKRRVIVGFVLSGVAFTLLALLIGYIVSRRSAHKLTQFEHTLTRVANGDLSARLPVHSPPEQIDMIADKINAQLSRLQRSVDTVTNTTKAIAHDLKTPLSRTQISLFSALDACDAGNNPEPFIQKALDENTHLNTVFETLLRISRLQSQTADNHAFQPFALAPMLDAVVEFLSLNAAENGQTLTVDCPPELQGAGDKDMLQQAVMNLVNNAITHAGEGAAIVVTARREAQQLSLSVCDTGKGIADADFKKVLAPFARLEDSRHSEGNGLGLALVHAIVEYHHGTITLAHNTPQGLCVTLRFALDK